MIACTLSNLEIRGIIERGFLPMRCNCSVENDRMTVEVIDPVTEQVRLRTTGIAMDRLDTSRALCELIGELRADLNNSSYHQPRALAG